MSSPCAASSWNATYRTRCRPCPSGAQPPCSAPAKLVRLDLLPPARCPRRRRQAHQRLLLRQFAAPPSRSQRPWRCLLADLQPVLNRWPPGLLPKSLDRHHWPSSLPSPCSSCALVSLLLRRLPWEHCRSLPQHPPRLPLQQPLAQGTQTPLGPDPWPPLRLCCACVAPSSSPQYPSHSLTPGPQQSQRPQAGSPVRPVPATRHESSQEPQRTFSAASSGGQMQWPLPPPCLAPPR